MYFFFNILRIENLKHNNNTIQILYLILGVDIFNNFLSRHRQTRDRYIYFY